MEMKKYIIPIVVILAFLSGLLNSGSKPEKELEALRKQERLIFTQQIIKKQVKIQEQDKLILAQQNKRIADSLYYAGKLSENKRAYAALKKKYNEINLNMATSTQLDSLVEVLFSDKR